MTRNFTQKKKILHEKPRWGLFRGLLRGWLEIRSQKMKKMPHKNKKAGVNLGGVLGVGT